MGSDAIEKRRKEKRRARSCFYFFKLETAMVIFTLIDVLAFIFYMKMKSFNYNEKRKHAKL